MDNLLKNVLHPAELLHELVNSNQGNNLPTKASITTYGRDGSTVAKNIDVSYGFVKGERVTESANGAGTLNLQIKDANNQPLSSSVINLDSNRFPSTIESSVYDNRDTSKIYKKTTTDFSNVNWLVDNIPAVNGDINITSKTNNDQIKASGSITYTNGKPQSAKFSNYTTGQTNEVNGQTIIDFTKTVLLGSHGIVGGSIQISRNDNANTLISTTEVHYSSLGLPTLLTSQSLTKQLKTTFNYASIAWSALKKIKSGTLNINVEKSDGTVAVTDIVYKNGKPVQSATNHLDNAANLIMRADLDDSTTKTISSAFDRTSGENTILVSSVDTNPAVHTTELKRKDGSLYKTTQTAFDDNKKPINSVIIEYDLDGKTIVKRTEVDYSNANFTAQGNILGQVVSRSLSAGKILKHTCTLQY